MNVAFSQPETQQYNLVRNFAGSLKLPQTLAQGSSSGAIDSPNSMVASASVPSALASAVHNLSLLERFRASLPARRHSVALGVALGAQSYNSTSMPTQNKQQTNNIRRFSCM